MTRWTHAQVTGFAPDAPSLTAARRLARPGPWSETGSTNTLVWGKCQGSGRAPYQVSVDLTGPAFRCTCASRKFPCKHALALLLMWVDGSGSVTDAAGAAGFAADWAAERSARAEARSAAEAGKPARVADPAAAAKRLTERLNLMTGGMEDFGRWLTDLVRSGSAEARQRPYGWWDAAAARLVDAQLPGLAEDVRAVGGEVSGRPDWAERLLLALGRWWTATRSWAGREALGEDELGDLRAYLGWSVSTDSVRRGEAIADRWLVLGAYRSDDGRLQQQRTWLHGARSGETVQVLDFAPTNQVLPVAQVVGSELTATLARYPGTAVRRALFVDEPAPNEPETEEPETEEPASLSDRLPWSSVPQARASAARDWGTNPWARRVVVALTDVRIGVVDGASGGAGQVVDGDGARLPLTEDADLWSVLALTGGRPTRIIGELEESGLRPLSVVSNGGLVACE